MAYTTNPHLPRVRAKAVYLIRKEGWSVAKTARNFGYHRATIHRWLEKASKNAGTIYEIPTITSRPKISPLAIDPKIIERIIAIRKKNGRCAEVVHARLKREGITVSLSTVIARQRAPFLISCVQPDHGQEFSKHFTTQIEADGVRHRHSRVRQPNDNAHVERFNRTLQEAIRPVIMKYRCNIPVLNWQLTRYLNYYNNDRLHMGLGCNTPNEVLQRS